MKLECKTCGKKDNPIYISPKEDDSIFYCWNCFEEILGEPAGSMWEPLFETQGDQKDA